MAIVPHGDRTGTTSMHTAPDILAIQDRRYSNDHRTGTGQRTAQGTLAMKDWNDENRNADDSHFMKFVTVGPSKTVANRGFDQLAGNPRQRAQKAMHEADAIEDAIIAYNRNKRTSDTSDLDQRVLRKIRKARRCICCCASCAFCWVILCMGCLVALPVVYWHITVGLTRGRFLLSVAKRVEAQATGSFNMALAARDAVHYAVQRKLYYEPSDYATVRIMLEPLFTAQPTLRAVELAFLERNGADESLVVWNDQSIVVRRLLGSSELGGAPGLLVQTDAPGCVEALGDRGCIVDVPAAKQDWINIAAELPCGREQCEGVGESGGDGNYRWLDAPGFVQWDAVEQSRSDDVVQSDREVHWAPAYSMVFRSVFPGSGGNLSVVGRATLDISRLSKDTDLNLEALGDLGGIYVCNRRGIILIAVEPERTCRPEVNSGVVHFRKAWELDFEWASELREGDFVGGRRFEAGSVEVVVEPIKRAGMDHLTVLVAAEKSGFADDQAMRLSALCQVLSYLPPGIILLVMAPVYISQRYRSWKHASLMRGLSTLKHRLSFAQGRRSLMSRWRSSSSGSSRGSRWFGLRRRPSVNSDDSLDS